VTAWLDQYQRRHPVAGLPLAVLYKYVDDSGGYLSALLTYYAFVSLFPLLLLLSTVMGFVLSGHPDLQHRVLASAVSQFPIVGKQIQDPKGIGGGPAGLLVGIFVSIYGGLGVAQAAQYAMNTAWRVPRHQRPNPLFSRLRSLLLVATAGVAVLLTTVLSAIGGSHLNSTLGLLARIGLLAASVVLNAGIFLFAFQVSTPRALTLRQLAPGAIGAAVVWQLLQSFGVVYVRHVVKHASDTNAVFAVVLGLIAFLYLTSVAVVLCVELNAVRVDRLYPRSLLTPFTDNVRLTTADKTAYADQARAQAMKGHEDIDVHFDPRAGAATSRPDQLAQDRPSGLEG
jgi:membrane protein